MCIKAYPYVVFVLKTTVYLRVNNALHVYVLIHKESGNTSRNIQLLYQLHQPHQQK